jgi:hypothetical protein
MKAFKHRFSLIDCGTVSKKTRGTVTGPFTEPVAWPNSFWG